MGIKRFLAKQAYKPSGLFGRFIIGKAFNKSNKNLEDMALEMMDFQNTTSFLEIGFGNGRLLQKVASLNPEGANHGIEISKAMINAAYKGNKKLIEQGKIHIHEGSVEAIPFGSGTFDIVFSANTIYFWPDPMENLKEVLRVLADEGKFYCGFRSREEMEQTGLMKDNPEIFSNLYNPVAIKELFKEAGFREVTVHKNEDKPFDNYIAVGRA